MADKPNALINLLPLILMISPFIIYYLVKARRVAKLDRLIGARLDVYISHLRNGRPDSARGTLKDMQQEFHISWSAWKAPLLIRSGRYFIEATKSWAETGRDRQHLQWTVALGETIVQFAPRSAEPYYRQVTYEIYHYLYQYGLTLLPSFPDLEIEVLRLGRVMGASGRQSGAATLYDEMAIANDIRAHLALARHPVPLFSAGPQQSQLLPPGEPFRINPDRP